MGLRTWNVGVLVSAVGLVAATGTLHEQPVFAAVHAEALRSLETAAAARPLEVVPLRALAQGYLDAHAPGMAIRAVDDAQAAARADASVQHVYARALLDEGRAVDALAAERGVLAACAVGTCETWLIASATRRADILRELVQLGVEDAQANPESAAVAYVNATREARLAVR